MACRLGGRYATLALEVDVHARPGIDRYSCRYR
jgi:hypothetical protein